MKNVLVSIRPKWVEKICHEIGKTENGKPIYEKRIEIRKTAPKDVPFKTFIYETYDKKYDDIGICWGNGKHFEHRCKKVIGEFVCDKISKYPRTYEFGYEISEKEFNETALTAEQFIDYGNGGTLYGWHISDLKIYDKPKELSEFRSPCSRKQCASWCKDMKLDGRLNCLNRDKRFLTRPPQSWQFVEELEK